MMTMFYLSQIYEFHMEMTCEGCANAAKRVLGKKGGISTHYPCKNLYGPE